MQILESDRVARDGFRGYGGRPGAVRFSHGEARKVAKRWCFWVEEEAVAAGEEGDAG